MMRFLSKQSFFILLMALVIHTSCKPHVAATGASNEASVGSKTDIGLQNIGPFQSQTVSSKAVLALAKEINQRNKSFDENLGSSTVTIFPLDAMESRMNLWTQSMPGVQPFFAVKANPDSRLVGKLCSLGVSFDAASIGEIKTVQNACNDCCAKGNAKCCSTKGYSDRMIFANPRKEVAHIVYAVKHGVNRMTFDSMDELAKMMAVEQELAQTNPNTKIEYVIRLKADEASATATIDFSSKFGLSKDEASALLVAAQKMQPRPNIMGIAFHSGSNTLLEGASAKAITDTVTNVSAAYQRHMNAATAVAAEMVALGFKPELLDLGGGWLGANDKAHNLIAKNIQAMVAAFKKNAPQDIEITAEPGRFFATQAAILAIRVNGIDGAAPGSPQRLYMSDGTYGSLHDMMLVIDVDFKLSYISMQGQVGMAVDTKVFGPTCDSMDQWLSTNKIHAPTLHPGDFLIVENAGAYTNATRTAFNYLTPGVTVYLDKGSEVGRAE